MDEKRSVKNKSGRGRPPKDKSKAIKKTEPLAKKAAQGDTIFALDIGTRTVVGVLAKKTPNGCKIIDMETVVHEKRSMADGQIEDIESVASDIRRVKRELSSRNRVILNKAHVAAAGRALKTMRGEWEYKLPDERITAETAHSAEMEAVRKLCAEFAGKNDGSQCYCVGHGVLSLTLDGFRVQKPEGHRGERLVTEVIGAFLPVYVVDSLYSALELAGLESAGLTLEPIAAMNAVVPQDLRLINLALCDIGAGTSDVAISRDGSVVSYGMATTAGDEITEMLMKELLIDFDTAERIKVSDDEKITYKNILLAENTISRAEIDKMIEPAAEDLADVIANEILEANTKPPQAVFLVGGGCKLKGLAKLVAQRLKIDPSKVITGSGGNIRGVILPEGTVLGAEHSTPMGIAVSAANGLPYDFTAITVNGKKLRGADKDAIAVKDLLEFAKITPEQLSAVPGQGMSFTLSDEAITIEGQPETPSEILVNGKAAALDTVVFKGDNVEIIPAENGANGTARLSDYLDMETLRSFTVTLFGEKLRAGKYAVINGRIVTADRIIHDGDVISVNQIHTLGELLESRGVTEAVLVNDVSVNNGTLLHSGDVIALRSEAAVMPQAEPVKVLVTVPETAEPVSEAVEAAPKTVEAVSETAKPVSETAKPVPETMKHVPEAVEPVSEPAKPVTETAKPVTETAKPVSETVKPVPEPAKPVPKATEPDSGNPIININGIDAEFPLREDGSLPIFLDVAKAFADDPTELLAHARVITLNGRIARLDEILHDGDVIVIE